MNEQQIEEFVFQVVGDIGACMSGPLVLIGDRLGLWTAIADSDGVTSTSLASSTDTSERYCREWLAAMAASGYVDFDGSDGFSMNEAQQLVFSNPESPVFLQGAFEVSQAGWLDEELVSAAFKSGEGIGWGEHANCLYSGTARFFRPAYTHHLVQDWIPAVPGMVASLENGGRLADIGVGLGVSTVVMAKAFPKATFVGFDVHVPSITEAKELAHRESVANVSFEVADAKGFGGKYDYVSMFDCLHDMGDPQGAINFALARLANGGRLMVVEPFANDKLADNLNPVGRVMYSASTFLCTPSALSQEGGESLGAQAGEARLRKIAEAAGASSFERVAETPFNIVFAIGA
ncbi:MAG: methyltransferase domain-containing protein [Acidobacteria bacterium]|nr:methyltransferase domain-containing protein [Acidobacteriota bacterium]